jgi:hypothetical protein
MNEIVLRQQIVDQIKRWFNACIPTVCAEYGGILDSETKEKTI